MANKKIDITITLKGENGSTSLISTPGANATTPEVKFAKQIPTVSSIQMESAAAAGKYLSQTVSWAIGEVSAQALFQIDFDLMRSDDYVGQRNWQNAQKAQRNLINITNGISNGALQGARMGMFFGPMGVAIGATIGGIVSGAETMGTMAHEAIRSKTMQDYQLNQMDNQLMFTRARAGYSTQAASIGEDL